MRSGGRRDSTWRWLVALLSPPLTSLRSEPYPPQLCQAIARVADHKVGGPRRKGPELAWPRRLIGMDGRLVLNAPVANAGGAAAAEA